MDPTWLSTTETANHLGISKTKLKGMAIGLGLKLKTDPTRRGLFYDHDDLAQLQTALHPDRATEQVA